MTTWLTALVVIAAATTWAAAMAVIFVLLRRVLRQPGAIQPAAVAGPALPQALPPAQDVHEEVEAAEVLPELRHLGEIGLLLPDYADIPTLTVIAVELGINVDATNVEEGIAIADATTISAHVESQLAIPQIASVETSIEAGATSGELRSHVVSTSRRSATAELLTSVIAELHKRGRLRVDLVDFPADSVLERLLALQTHSLFEEWELFKSPAPPVAGATQVAAASESEQAQPPDANAPLRAAVDTLFSEATRRIRELKAKELRAVADDPAADFALTMCTWTSWTPDPERLELWSLRLHSPPAFKEQEWIQITNMVKVIMDADHMTRFGKHRFTHNVEVRALVFAKIGTMHDASGCLNVVPLMIYPL